MTVEKTESRMLPLNIQFFAEGAAEGGAENTAGSENGAGDNNGAETAQETEKRENNTFSTEEMKKFIQSEVDKGLAEERKQNAALRKENENLKKAQMTAEELKKYEAEKREKELTKRDNALTERENRLFAIEAIKEIGLDDGSKQSLDLVDFVMAKDTETITTRVKAFKSLVDRFVTAKVEQTFKANGRAPKGGNAGTGGEEGKDTSFAAELGKKQAATAKQANDILKYYYGG